MSTAARPRSPRCCGCSTAPAWLPGPSASPGPASTTSSSGTPVARCATRRRRHAARRPPHRPAPAAASPTARCRVSPRATDRDHRKDPPMKLLRDTRLIFQRSFRLTLLQPVWVFIGLSQPILYLLLFGPLLEKVVQAPGFPEGGAWNIFVPGLLVQIALFGGAFVGFGLVAQIRYGVVERLRVTPVSRTALLLGMALRDIVILEVQALVLIGLSIPLGLHIDPAGVLVTMAILALVGLALGSGSYVIALVTKSEDARAPVVNSIAIPLLLLSGMLLPMALAPEWLRTVAQADPLLHAVEGIRAVFLGHPGDQSVFVGLAMFAILAVLGLWGAGKAF